MKNMSRMIFVSVVIIALVLPWVIWACFGDNNAATVADILILWATIAAVVVVVVGWRMSLEMQRKANRDNAKLEAMKQYQSQLQERYEKDARSACSFFIINANVLITDRLLRRSEQCAIKDFFEGLHEDAKEMESGVLPYYLTLQSNTFFNDDLVSMHAVNIDKISTDIRDILGHHTKV